MKLSDLIVSPQNARSEVKVEDLSILTDSVRQNDLVSKLVLRPRDDGKYEVVSGQRRMKALMEIYGEDYELQQGDYVIRENLDDKNAFILSLQENVVRVDLSPMDLNRAILKLNEWGYKDKEIARLLNITPHRMKRLANLSMDINKMPEAVKEELSKPDHEGKFNDLHWDKIRDLEDPDMIKDVVDYIVEHDSAPREVPTIVKGVEKQYSGELDGNDSERGQSQSPGEVGSAEAVPTEPIEYSHKGQLVLESHGGQEILKVIGKGEEEEVPVEHYLEYLRHPEKFRVQVTFKLKVKPLD